MKKFLMFMAIALLSCSFANAQSQDLMSQASQAASFARLATATASGDQAGMIAAGLEILALESGGPTLAFTDDGAPANESEESRIAREELIKTYKDIFGKDDPLLTAFCKGGNGVIVIKEHGYFSAGHSCATAETWGRDWPISYIDKSVLKDKGQIWGVLALRKHMLYATIHNDNTRNYIVSRQILDGNEKAIIESQIKALDDFGEEIIKKAEELAELGEVVISLNDAGDVLIAVKDIADPDKTVTEKVVAAASAGLPLVNTKAALGAVFWIKKGTLVRKGIDAFSYAEKYGIGSYSELKKLVKPAKEAGEFGGDVIQVHHLIEQRFSELFNQKKSQMLSIVLTKEEHQVFTNLWRNKIPYGEGTATATKELVERRAREIYKDYPEILDALGLAD